MSDVQNEKCEDALAQYGVLMSVGDVAEVLSVSTRTIYRFAETGELDSLHVGHRLYFPKALLLTRLHLDRKVSY